MSHRLSYKILILSATMLICQTGCWHQNTDAIIHRREILDLKEMSKITILPVADGRRKIDKKVDFKKETYKVQERLFTCLKEKGYDSIQITDTSTTAIGPQQVPFADAKQIAEIGSVDSRWVIVPVVDRLDTPWMGNRSSSVACYLFDKRIGKLVWEGSISGCTIWTSNYRVEDAIDPIIKGFPEKSR